MPGLAGDANNDGYVHVTDLVVLYDWLWKGKGSVCGNDADVNGDGAIDGSDSIGLFHM